MSGWGLLRSVSSSRTAPILECSSAASRCILAYPHLVSIYGYCCRIMVISCAISVALFSSSNIGYIVCFSLVRWLSHDLRAQRNRNSLFISLLTNVCSRLSFWILYFHVSLTTPFIVLKVHFHLLLMAVGGILVSAMGQLQCATWLVRLGFIDLLLVRFSPDLLLYQLFS